MDKETFVSVLQVCLFTLDGATEQEIIEFNDYSSEVVKVGRDLCFYLKSKELNGTK